MAGILFSVRSRRNAVYAFALVILLTIVVGVLAEAASRVFFYACWGGHLYPMQPNEYSLRLGWKLTPGTYRLFQINNQGFRRPHDVSLNRPEKTIRIFIIGGSTAFGTNGLYPQVNPAPLKDTDTIDFQLEKMLQARHPAYHFEVINAAVSEYRLFQEFTLFQERLVNFSPHLVIFLDGHNDISFVTQGETLKDPSPFWKHRHFTRGQHALNESGLVGLLYYLDIHLGRTSYLYHGASTLHQRFHEVVLGLTPGSVVGGAWGEGVFHLSDEQALKVKYQRQLNGFDATLPAYLELVKDLKTIAVSRRIKVLYGLQPEIVLEKPADLTNNELQIQQIAFQHHGDVGTLGWRYLSPKIAMFLADLNDSNFHVVNLTTIAERNTEDLYTDYCHLTANGNRVVAERLYPMVEAMIRLPATHLVSSKDWYPQASIKAPTRTIGRLRS